MLRRAKTKETLLLAGGEWDAYERRFTDKDPSQAKIINLEESQVAFTRWYAGWLRDFREGFPRDTSLAIAGGDRRGGKTFDLLMCTIATMVDVPRIGNSGTLGWVVSVNYQERDEIDKTVREWIPAKWYHYYKAPEFRYAFVHGASLRNVSADDPETLKRGRVDIVLFNEAQKMPVAALSNGIYGTVDKAGIALLAANPPRRQVGEWVLTFKEAIDEEKIKGAKFFGFSSKENTQIDLGARSRVGDILRLIDPKAALADDEGAWLPVGDRAYPKYDRKKHLEKPPAEGDITAGFMSKKAGRPYATVGGVDFQGTPWHAGAVCRIYGTAEKPIYWFVDEIISEQSTEDDFLDDVDDKGYSPESLFWVADASGAWQNGRHSLNGRQSFDIFKARRWHIVPPRKKKSAQGEFAKNPYVADRLGLVFKLMEEGRIKVDPDKCPRLDEAFKDCPLKSINTRRLPSGRHAHITDAAGYLLWFLEPKPTPAARADNPGMFLVPGARRTSDW